ncbi:hypothetical protein b3_0220 [Synechococcus phage B3]|jgi:hypothetical protein|nr:hypothetical protein b3_0220 [Synechococcus phage B3]QGT54833.1 hypothetical protein b23_0218 [Synechococcus phage B23]
MKAHELGLKLLNGPNHDVLIEDPVGCLRSPLSTFESNINGQNEEMCGDAEGRLGETIVKIVL